MNKRFENNGNISENPFDIRIVKDAGELGDYYLIKGGTRKKITLADLIKEQVGYVKNMDSERCSSGCLVRIGSSGDRAQIGSSGNSAQIGSSGNSARIGSSGDHARIGSSGDLAQIGSSGNSAQIGSSGNYAQIGSSGNYVQIGSSGDRARIGSSGDHAQIGSGGDSAQIGSSGYYAQIGSSGHYARINVKGNSGVAFACGLNSVIKAKNGTWISLCEYAIKEGKLIPVFALSAQIGNNDYVDYKGEVLSENNYYILKDKQFTPVIIDDGLILIKISSRVMNGIEIIRCKAPYDLDETFCVRKGELSAYGETLHQAIADLVFKEMQNRDVSEIVEKIKECGYVTREDYRCITGACSSGTEQFAKEHGYAEKEKAELNELLLKLDDRYYGAKKFKELFQ